MFVTPFFERSVNDEIRRAAPFKVVKKSVNYMIIESKGKNLAQKLCKDKGVFVYSIFPILARRKVDKRRYVDSIYKALMDVKPKKWADIKIEILDVNSKQGFSAKDLEVKFGERMEGDGLSINILRPQTLLYSVIWDMECFVGIGDMKQLEKGFLDPFRHYARANAGIGRAELKIREAFDDFGLHGRGIALDLGAAPGGWSVFLAQNGYKVIAVDNGDLAYGKIKRLELRCRIMDGKKGDAESGLKRCDILHIRSGFDGALRSIDLKKVDLLVNDMNIRHNLSAEAMLKFSKKMRKGVPALMTVKCVRRSVDRYLAQTKKILSKDFEVVGVRVLPHNRQEATMLLLRK